MSDKLHLKHDIDTRSDDRRPDDICGAVDCTAFKNENGCGFNIYITQADYDLNDEPVEANICITHYQAYLLANWILSAVDKEWCGAAEKEEAA